MTADKFDFPEAAAAVSAYFAFGARGIAAQARRKSGAISCGANSIASPRPKE
jgi:hypothetical protein